MENTTQPVVLTPQEKKEQFITNLKAKIIEKIGDGLSAKFETSSCAPSFGWSVEEYNYMPHVAERLRKEGYTVTSSVNHGVTDWLITV